MLRNAIVGALAILPFSVLAATYPSPPRYPSFNSSMVSGTATVKTIDVPGETFGTYPAAINDGGVITGYYKTGTHNIVGHGFVRTKSGKITTFDAPDAGNTNGSTTRAYSINKSGVIVGYYSNGANQTGSAFIRTPDGTLTEFNPHSASAIGAEARAINNAGVVAGFYDGGIDAGGCFIRSASGSINEFYCGQTGVALAMNATKTITGDWGNETQIAFLRASDGTITKFHKDCGSAKDVDGTEGLSINSAGTITGKCSSQGDVSQFGFTRTNDGTITKFRVPKAYVTDAVSINDAGIVAGDFQIGDGDGVVFSVFTRAADGKITTFQIPGRADNLNTAAINNKNVIVGSYVDINGETHGFILTPTSP